MSSSFLNSFVKDNSGLDRIEELLTIQNETNESTDLVDVSKFIEFKGNVKSKIAIVTFKNQNIKENLNAFIYNPELTSVDSIMDVKMYNYLKPFQIIRFDNTSINNNIQNSNNQKFHVELLPNGSKEFSVNDLISNLSESKLFVDQILNGVLAYPRQYVVFVGNLFLDILSEYIVETDRFSFMLTSPNKVNQKITAYFTRITINYKGRKLIAGIAESFFDSNFDDILLEKYGQESVYLINRGLLLSNPVWVSQQNLKK
ncbi:MAG: hypothetical protein AB9846_00175 [Tenuifilaceae bacterium]